MNDETNELPSNAIESRTLLESLIKFIDEGTLLPDREFESKQSERWWYEDRDELLKKCRAHIADSNRIINVKSPSM